MYCIRHQGKALIMIAAALAIAAAFPAHSCSAFLAKSIDRRSSLSSPPLGAVVGALVPPGPATLIETVTSPEAFDEIIRGNSLGKKVVAVWFQASWCRKCKYVGTRLRHLEEHLPPALTNNLAIVSLDVNKVARIPQQQKIKDLPTIKFYVAGEEVGSYVATDRGEVFYNEMKKHTTRAMEKT